jgi:hypothetical protein
MPLVKASTVMKRRLSFAPRHALAMFLAASAVLSMAGGCGRQSEGDHCSLDNGDEDCDSGLVCTPAEELQQGQQDDVDRCCPPDGGTGECAPRGAVSGSGGGTGLGGEGNEGGAGGAQGNVGSACDDNGDCVDPLVCSAGECSQPSACVYNSDCLAPLACINGECRPECNEDRDCTAGFVCSTDRQCVAE